MKEPLVLQKAENVATKPQAKVIPPSHLAGCMRFKMALEGVSKSCACQYWIETPRKAGCTGLTQYVMNSTETASR